MVKTMLCVGSRKKCDTVIFLAHVISKQNKRVLIVDHTANQTYREGYVRLDKDETLYDLQGIDILVGSQNWLDVERQLKLYEETTVNYDFILFDIDFEKGLDNEYPVFDECLYIGDFERDHLNRDGNMLKKIKATYPKIPIRRLTFASKYKINADLIHVYLPDDFKWHSIHMLFDADESVEELRLTIQYEQTIPYKLVNPQHKELLEGLVSELFQLHTEEVQEGMKQSFFKNIFGKKQQEKQNKNHTKETKDRHKGEYVLDRID